MELPKLSEWILKNYWVFLLAFIFLIGLYLRCIPGTKLTYPKLQAIDPYFIYRMGENIIQNGTVPKHDSLAAWGTIPGGPDRTKEHLVVFWAYPVMYFLLHPLFGVSFYWIAVWVPAFFGAIQVLLTYFLAKALFDDRRIALLSAFFVAIVPGILYRVAAGFIEKEPVAGIFMLLGLYFFIKSVKTEYREKRFALFRLPKGRENLFVSVIYAVFSGLSLALMAGAWGGVRIPLIIIGVFVFLISFLNRHINRLLVSHISMFVVFFVTSRVFHVSPNLSSASVVLNTGVASLLIIRYAVEKLSLVQKENLKYVMPALAIFSLICVFTVAYVEPDIGRWIGDNIARVTNPISLGVIPSTVAESQPAGQFLRNTLTTFGTGYAVTVFKLPEFITFLSIIYFAFLGVFLMVYEFLYRKFGFEYVFGVIFFILCMALAMGAIRLNYVFAFPVSISAGYFFVRAGSYVMQILKKTENRNIAKYVKITGIVLVFVVCSVNFLSGFVMASNIYPSLDDSWYNALIWLRDNTSKDSVILEWWDFGWWFHEIAERRTLVDGGYHSNIPTRDVAKFFTTPLSNKSLNFLKNFSVTYVMVSPDLIPKFGAMSKIANWGTKVDVLPVFTLSNTYQEGNKVLLEYSAGGQKIIVAYSIVKEGNMTGMANITALVKTGYGQAYIRDIGINGERVIRTDKPNAINAMVYLAGNNVIFIPGAVEDCVFVRLYLFNGKGLENLFEKVYDSAGIKIYRVRYENFPDSVTGEYTPYGTAT